MGSDVRRKRNFLARDHPANMLNHTLNFDRAVSNF
jgi:hypothetical protein